MKRLLIFPVLLCCALHSEAQKTKKTQKDAVAAAPTPPPIPLNGTKPYKVVITDKAVTQKGLYMVHRLDDKWYFEIPDSLMKRETLVVTRYSGTPAGGAFYGGEVANEQTIYWEKANENKLLLRSSLYIISARDSLQAISKAVRNASIDPIVAAFDIKAINPDNKNVVIDVTDFFKGDNQVVSLSAESKRRNSLGMLATDRSYISKISSYPLNTEVKTVKTFSPMPGAPSLASFFGGGDKTSPAGSVTGAVTFELNNSFLLLPKVPMRKRLFDERVGYFADIFTSYNDAEQRSKALSYIVRWRLEPKDEDLEKFRRGELVEPKKPIVYYIDPATPKKWRPYLIAGINDWQKAFEQAGFKNAIIGKEWPESDTTMSLEDSRYSVIRYFASDVTNAYGPNVHDPRSGEILESHIGWYHNVMTLVHDWYMIQAGAIDPRGRKMEFDDELMGQLIRFVSSHEIGHTLGLRHNMGASSQTPVEKLRDKKWVEANGHTVSIMDYARFNYVAQPEDNIGEAGIFPRIGAYDKWAIEWGYKPILDTRDEEADRKKLNKLIVDSLSLNPKLWFGGEGGTCLPKSQSEDLGDNAMKASTYGIKNLQRVMKNLPEWTREEGDLYENLKRMYNQVVNQYKRYNGHVAQNIGGAYWMRKSVEQTGSVWSPVPKSVLKEAVSYFDSQVFTTPGWLYDERIINKIGIQKLSHLNALQDDLFNYIMNPSLVLQVWEQANLSKNPYTVDEYFTDLERSIFKELTQKGSIDIYRRNLQKNYLQRLSEITSPPAPPMMAGGVRILPAPSLNTDVRSIAMAHVKTLDKRIAEAIPSVKDKETLYHLQDMRYRIKKILKVD